MKEIAREQGDWVETGDHTEESYELFNMIGEGEGFTMAEMTSTMGPWFGKFTAATEGQ